MSPEQAPVSELPPVPEPPGFPVYGLAASFPGRRWLDVWNRIDRAFEVADDLTGPDWSTSTAVVADTSVTFHMCTRNDAWAAVTDLGEVAVGAFGRDLRLSDYPLVALSDLSNYPIREPQSEGSETGGLS